MEQPAIAGNGHGGIPISPLTGATRYRTKRRGPLRLLGKFFLWLAMIVLVAAGALAGGAWLYINESVAEVRAHSQPLIDAQQDLDVPTPDQPTVALVIGYDKRLGPESSLGSRSDTVMLLRADPQKKVISMMSFPRDLVVTIPGCAGQLPFSGRINEAYTYCGPRGTLKTVKELTGIPINYIITVNFIGFRDIVDKLGGVYLDVDHRYFNDNSNGENYATIDLHSGYQHLTGKQALDYVRFRHTDSDLYRVVRQQSFVKAMKQQIAAQLVGDADPRRSSTRSRRTSRSASAAARRSTYRHSMSTRTSPTACPSGNFQQVQIENISGYNELSASQTSIDDAVNDFMNPDVSGAREGGNGRARREAEAAAGHRAAAFPGQRRGSERQRRRGCRRPGGSRARRARLSRHERRQRGQLQLLQDEDPLRPQRRGRRGGGHADGRPLRRRRRGSGAAGRAARDDAAGHRRPDLPWRPHAGAGRQDADPRAARDHHGFGGCRRAEERQEEGGLPALYADRARGELVALHARACA